MYTFDTKVCTLLSHQNSTIVIKIMDELNNISIYEFMVKQLSLKGYALYIYAYIYEANKQGLDVCN